MADPLRQYSRNHLEVKELSPSNLLMLEDLASKITAIGKHYGGRLLVQFRVETGISVLAPNSPTLYTRIGTPAHK